MSEAFTLHDENTPRRCLTKRLFFVWLRGSNIFRGEKDVT